MHYVSPVLRYFGLRNYNGGAQEIGAERTPAAYVAHLVDVFRAVHRVLRNDGTLFIVLGDSYGHGTSAARQASRTSKKISPGQRMAQGGRHGGEAKNLMLIPHRVALALQADGWIVRNDCVWAKGSAMPESVQDRFSRAHEYVFHLAKSERYYFDPIAVAEEASSSTRARAHLGQRPLSAHQRTMQEAGMHGASETLRVYDRPTRNRRSVLHINPQPFSAAAFGVKDIDHYAVMPEKLVEILTLCSTSEAGCCPRCSAPYRRVVERSAQDERVVQRTRNVGGRSDGFTRTKASGGLPPVDVQTTGWQAGCSCAAGPPIGCTVMDIFCGSGTTGVVAKRYGRNFIGIELNESYCTLSEKRIAGVCEPLFTAATVSSSSAGAAR